MTRKICLIPLYGSIAYFFYISRVLRRNNNFSRKTEFYYLMLMAVLGVIGMLLAGATMYVLKIDFDNTLWGIIISILYLWVLVTLPVIEYSKKIEHKQQ